MTDNKINPLFDPVKITLHAPTHAGYFDDLRISGENAAIFKDIVGEFPDVMWHGIIKIYDAVSAAKIFLAQDTPDQTILETIGKESFGFRADPTLTVGRLVQQQKDYKAREEARIQSSLRKIFGDEEQVVFRNNPFNETQEGIAERIKDAKVVHVIDSIPDFIKQCESIMTEEKHLKKQVYVGIKIVQAEPWVKDGRDGYSISYPDGYISWSPKETFEEANICLGNIADKPAFLQRLYAERAELYDRIDKLTAFLHSEKVESLLDADRGLLTDQRAAMAAYLGILDMRIARIEEPKS